MIWKYTICYWLLAINTALPKIKQGPNALFVHEADIHTSAHAWAISFPVDIIQYETQIVNLYDSMGLFL